LKRAKGRRRVWSSWRLDDLRTEWEALFHAMQVPGWRDTVERAFSSSPTELGAATVRVARRSITASSEAVSQPFTDGELPAEDN